MAAKLGLLSLTQLQQLAAQSQPDSASAQASWMWSHTNPSKDQEDDSWEVKAFAEDYTGTASGSTWPPRSYSCSFCRREFRSAQALGGHMNVHRRDRASGRLQQTLVQSQTATTTAAAAASAFIIPAQELSAINGGLCLLYKLPHPNYQPNAESSSSLMNARKAESPSSFTGDGHWGERNIAINYKVSGEEDLDLELRLGQKPIKS